MPFLKILFLLLLALLILFFAYGNWSDVTLNLWGGLVMDVKTPMLLLLVFLLGMISSTALRAGRERRRRRASRPAPAPAPSPITEEDDPF